MTKTSKDIRSSLDICRKVRAPSITEKIENELKGRLEREYGPILSEDEKSEIIDKVNDLKEKQRISLDKSRMKILKVKERSILMQETKRSPGLIKQSHSKRGNIVRKKEKRENPAIKRVVVKY